MKNLNLKNIKNSNGFVAIGTLLIGSLVVASGAFLMPKLALKVNAISANSNNSLNISKQVQDNNCYAVTNNSEKDSTLPKDDNVDNDTCSLEGQSLVDFLKYQDVEIDGIKGIEITSYRPYNPEKDIENKNQDNVVIPTYINGKKVISISNGAFMSSGIKNITLPKYVMSIGDNAFVYVKHINNLPDTIKYIGENAFRQCSFENNKLKLPNSLIAIGNVAFNQCHLEKVDFPNGLKSIGCNAFADNRLTELNLPDSIEFISNYAFYNNSISDVKLPNNPMYISESAFSNNPFDLEFNKAKADSEYNYKEITINGENGVEITGYDGSEKNIEIPSSIDGKKVISIGGRAFEGKGLTNVKIPDTVKRIGFSAFENNSLSEITVPDSVDEVQPMAFRNAVVPRGEFHLPDKIKAIIEDIT